MPTLGLCAILSDNAKEYVEEWIDYNLLAIEFDDVYIYDNSRKYNATFWNRIIRRHNLQGQKQKLHVIHFPESRYTKQILAYNQCVETFQKQSDYLAFLDDDEFLVLYKHPNVASLLMEHCPTGSLSIPWRIFGTSNHTKPAPNVPVTKRFQFREHQMDIRVKSIVRVRDFVSFKSPHSVETRPGTVQKLIDGSTEFSETGASTRHPCCEDIAVLNHYKYKSKQEYMYKSCVRQSVTKSDKGCDDASLPAGTDFDDTAWQLLTSKVPKYANFDNNDADEKEEEDLLASPAPAGSGIDAHRPLNFIHVRRTARKASTFHAMPDLELTCFCIFVLPFRFPKQEEQQSLRHPFKPISHGRTACLKARTEFFNAHHRIMQNATTATLTVVAVTITPCSIFPFPMNVQIRMKDKTFLLLSAIPTIGL